MKRETDLLNLISTYITSWLDKPFKFSGLAILLALFFASCEEPLEAPSSKLVPNDNNTNLKYIELPLEASQAAFDTSIVSSNNVNGSEGIIYVGHHSDDQIGDASLEAYAGLALSSGFNREDISSSAELIDINLVLTLSYLHGTEFNKSQQFNVYRLDGSFSTNSRTYKLNDSIASGELISLDNNTIIDPDEFLHNENPDSLVIPLENTYGLGLIRSIADETLDSEALSKAISGVKIEVFEKIDAIEGVDLTPANSYMEIAYNNPGDSLNDTLRLSLTAASFTNAHFTPKGVMPTNYSANRSFALNDDSQVYFNSLLGIYPKIKIDGYLSFIDSLDYMIIDKAEIVLGKDLSAVDNLSEQTNPPAIIFPYFLNSDRIEKVGEDFWGIQRNFSSTGGVSNQSAASNLLALNYREDESIISGDVSLFLQEVFDNRDFWDEERSILLNGQFINRNSEPFDPRATFTIGNYNNFLINSNDIKLRIYYTTFEN